MIRNTMIGLSMFALLSGSALAAGKHAAKTTTVAAAPAADTAKEPAKADAPKADAPKADAPKTDAKKKTSKKDKAAKGDAAKTEGAKEMKSAPEPTK